MFDLKVINSVLTELEEDRGISRQKMIAAIEQALATAYKKEFGERGQIIRADFDMNSGVTTFNQIKLVVDEGMLKKEDEETETDGDEEKVNFDEEKHILINTAKLIKKDVTVGEELMFPLENKDNFSRIAAQTAKQVIVQKIREAEKESAVQEFGQKAGDIVLGHVQRFERGNLYIDLGRVTGVIPYDEQIPGERYRPGERIRCLLLTVEETGRGILLKLSRAHPDFLKNLFAVETPELQSGAVTIKCIAREAGSRSKIAVHAKDEYIDPVGAMVGQRGVRVSTVMSELGGEKIDIIEWSEDPVVFIEDALSPAQVLGVQLKDPTEGKSETKGNQQYAVVEVAGDQQSLAIGRGGQNVRLAAKLTGYKIDIISIGGEEIAESDGNQVTVADTTEISNDIEVMENEEATTAKAEIITEDQPTEDRDVKGLYETEEIDTPEEAETLIEEATTAEATEVTKEKDN